MSDEKPTAGSAAPGGPAFGNSAAGNSTAGTPAPGNPAAGNSTAESAAPAGEALSGTVVTPAGSSSEAPAPAAPQPAPQMWYALSLLGVGAVATMIGLFRLETWAELSSFRKIWYVFIMMLGVFYSIRGAKLLAMVFQYRKLQKLKK